MVSLRLFEYLVLRQGFVLVPATTILYGVKSGKVRAKSGKDTFCLTKRTGQEFVHRH